MGYFHPLPAATSLLCLMVPRRGVPSMISMRTSSTPMTTLVTPGCSDASLNLVASESLIFDELPAPLERVLLAEEGAAAERGMASAVEQDACALLGAAGLDDGEQLSLTLCDDEVIRGLNSEWRQKDAPTDVLSFPMDDSQLLGDLVISLDTAARQAKERGHGLRDEVRILMVHGVLHLLGYDHEVSDEEHLEMAAAERKLLRKLGWAGSGLIDCAEDDAA